MALRFRKSFKVAPGVRLNVSGSGSSVSLGGRGFTTNVSKRGTRSTVSLPGTGLSYSSSSRRSPQAAQRRLEKAERERQREEALSKISVAVDDAGAVTCSDAKGEVLKGRDLSLVWERHGDAIRTLMQDALDRINGDVGLLEGIFHDAPYPSPETLLLIEPFSKPEPKEPKRQAYPSKPCLELPKEPGVIARAFGGQKRFEKRVQKLEAEHVKANDVRQKRVSEIDADFANALKQWQSDHSDWIAAKKAYAANADVAEKEYHNQLSTDQDFAQAELEAALNDLDWPRETLTSYDLEREQNRVWLDVDLPEIEDLPERVATFAATGKKLNVKNKPQKALRLEYAHHIHGIVLRLACVTCATLPWADEVVISGYSQRMDTATGHTNDDYLLSVRFKRTGLEQLNFSDLPSVDPVSAIPTFDHIRKMTATGIFKAITPFAPE